MRADDEEMMRLVEGDERRDVVVVKQVVAQGQLEVVAVQV